MGGQARGREAAIARAAPTKARRCIPERCINEDGLPSAAIRFSPMEPYYVGLDVHSRQSAFVIEDGEERVMAQGEVPTTRAAFERLRAVQASPATRGDEVAVHLLNPCRHRRPSGCGGLLSLRRVTPRPRLQQATHLTGQR